MSTLHELYIKRKNQIKNCNGTEALRNRIDQQKKISGEEHQHFAKKLKGSIETLFDHQIITFQDAKDWEWIVESNVKDVNNV